MTQISVGTPLGTGTQWYTTLYSKTVTGTLADNTTLTTQGTFVTGDIQAGSSLHNQVFVNGSGTFQMNPIQGNTKEMDDFRVIVNGYFSGAVGAARNIKCTLRRTDGTFIASIWFLKLNGVAGISESYIGYFPSRAFTVTDPYFTQGFYLSFENISGATWTWGTGYTLQFSRRAELIPIKVETTGVIYSSALNSTSTDEASTPLAIKTVNDKLPITTHGTLVGLTQPIGTEFPNPIIIDNLKFSNKVAQDTSGLWYNLYITNNTGAAIGMYINGHNFGSEHEVYTVKNDALANGASLQIDAAYSFGQATAFSTNEANVTVIVGGLVRHYYVRGQKFNVGTTQHSVISVTKLL